MVLSEKRSHTSMNVQQKGKRHEYHVRDILKTYGYEARRTPMSGAISFLKGDILSDSFPFFIECKDDKKASFLKWWKKAQSESSVKPAIVVWTINREDIYTFIRFTDLLDIMKKGIVTKDKKVYTHKRASLDETAGFAFSKKQQVRRPKKYDRNENT
jgi:hypothetical protein